MAGAKSVIAITSFVCDVDGVERFVRPGESFLANDPVVKKHRELFDSPLPLEPAITGKRRQR